MRKSPVPAGDMVPLIEADWPQTKLPTVVAAPKALPNPSGGGGGAEQLPLTHVDPLAQTLPQAPQLPGSDCKFVHRPLHKLCPAPQLPPQTPLTHACWVGRQFCVTMQKGEITLGHTFPQVPQLLESDNVSSQIPLSLIHI